MCLQKTATPEGTTASLFAMVMGPISGFMEQQSIQTHAGVHRAACPPSPEATNSLVGFKGPRPKRNPEVHRGACLPESINIVCSFSKFHSPVSIVFLPPLEE